MQTYRESTERSVLPVARSCSIINKGYKDEEGDREARRIDKELPSRGNDRRRVFYGLLLNSCKSRI